ncbi:MAG: hypothetical protein FJ253_07495, partial [Phycisphaerae bacterium]|nr:hypothetical protein [Phycisphaerae bacterium]
MNRALARIVVGALAPATLATPAGAVLKTWTGAGGNLLWSSPDNWDPVGVPGEGDDVVIGLPMAVEVIYAGGTTTIESLVCQCSIRFVSGTLCTVSTATVLGLPTLAGGSLRDGTWTLGQPLSVTSNANNRIDGVTIIGGIRLEFAGSQLRVANGLSVSGQVWLGGAGAVIRYENSQTWGPATLVAPAGANAKIEPFAGGAALTLASSFSLEGGGWTIAGGAMSPTVVNHGLLRTTAAGSAAINANTFANFGTVRSLAGTLSINSNLWTNPGGALQAIGATLRFGGGVFDNGGQNTALDPNTGTLLLDGATIMGGKLHLLPPGALMVSNSAANRLSSVEVMGNLSLLAAGSQLRTVKGLSVMGQVLVGPGSQLGFEGSQTWGPADVLAFGAPGNPARIGIALQPSSELMLTEDFSLDGSWWQFNSGAGLNAEIENWGWLESTMGQSLIGGAPFRNEGEVRALGGTLTLPPLLWNLDKGVLMHGTWTTEAGATMVWPMVTPEIEQLQSAIVNINGTMVGLPAEEGVAGGVPFPFEPLRTIDEDSILRIGPMRKLFFLPTDGTLANHGVLGIGAQSLASVGGGYSQSPEATLETAYDSVLEVPPLITGGDISLDGLLAVEFAKGFDPAACEPLFVVGTKGGSVVGTFGGIIPPCGGACPVTPFYGSDYAAIFSEGAVPDV